MENPLSKIIEEGKKELREYYVEMHPMHGHDSHNPPLLYHLKTDDVNALFKDISTVLTKDLLQGFLTEINETEKAEFGNDNLGTSLKIARLRKVVEGAINNLSKE